MSFRLALWGTLFKGLRWERNGISACWGRKIEEVGCTGTVDRTSKYDFTYIMCLIGILSLYPRHDFSIIMRGKVQY